MILVKKIAKNSGIFIFGNIADTLFSLAISISLAKYFGQSGFGKLSFLATFFFFLGSMDNQWIAPILVRDMSRDANNSGRLIGNGLIIRALISILAISIFWITIWIVNAPVDIVKLAFFTSVAMLLTSFVSSYGTIFQVNLKMEYFVGFTLLSRILTLVLICIIVIFKGNLFHFYLLSLIPSVILLFSVKYYAEKLVRPTFKIDFKLWHKIFREAWPLALTAFFIFIYHRLDQIMLLYFKGIESLGLYSAAVKLTESFSVIPIALMISLLPVMSKYHETSQKNFDKMYQLSFKYLLTFIIPVAFGASFFSDRIVSIFYGKDFLSSSPALRILIWSEVFVFMGVVNNSILISANKQKIDPLFTGASALVNIILNLILIPKYSYIGAAIASLIAYSTGPIMGYFIHATHLYSRCMLYYSLKPILASLITISLVYYSHFYFLGSIFVAPLIYLLTMYLIKGFRQDDIILVKSLIST